MEAFESFEHAGFTVELHPDYDNGGPGEWDQLGTVYFVNKGEQLQGTEVSDGEADDAIERGGAALLIRYLRLARGEYAVPFQFQDYGSSGARIHALDESGDGARISGYISTTRKRFEELCGAWGYKPDDFDGTPDEWLVHTLSVELGEWNSWVAGEVVGMIVRDDRGEIVDSCWGFYPDGNGDGLEYVREQAREAAEYERDRRAKRKAEVLQGWAWARGGRGEAMPV